MFPMMFPLKPPFSSKKNSGCPSSMALGQVIGSPMDDHGLVDFPIETYADLWIAHDLNPPYISIVIGPISQFIGGL